MRSTIVVVLAVSSAGFVAAQGALPDRGAALVTAGDTFVFYSDLITNLHDFLVWNARSDEPIEPATDCLAGLPAEQRVAFEHARQHYEVFATPTGDRLLLALRYRLAGFGDFELADAGAIEAALAELPRAAPAYEKCWWSAHDARNRRWIAAVEALLAVHEEVLSARLSALYGKELGRPFPLDVVSYGSVTGADSVVDPDHLLVSSVVPANAGYAALEVVFHEASHTVFGPRPDGPLWSELDAAARDDGEPLPADFWHALLFYTTGAAVKARLAEDGVAYEQYLYTQGLFDRSWSGYRGPLERFWQPYVDGHASMAEALKQLVAAHEQAYRGDALVAASRTFAFYSDVVTNLHDFLVWNARSQEPIEPAGDCLARLPAEQRAAFEHAREYYASTFANGGGELVLLSLRWRLAKLSDVAVAEAAQIAATVAELAAARPAYEECWWPAHDARNREWIASLLPLLDANENALRVRLAELYGRQLTHALAVDVVGYASASGSNTVFNPHHVLISSARAANAAYSGFEMLFHEASHTIFGPRTQGPLWAALREASIAGTQPLPEPFTHLLLFLTTGTAVQARLAEQGVPDYSPYVYRERLFEQSPLEYRQVLERVWRPYIERRVPMADAAKQVVEALPAGAR